MILKVWHGNKTDSKRGTFMEQNSERKVINLSKPSDRISSDTMFKECNYTIVDGERYIVPPEKEEIKVIDNGISTGINTNVPTKVTKPKIGEKIKATLLAALAVSGIAFFTVSTVKTAFETFEIKNTVAPEKIEVVVEPQIEIPDVKIEVEQPVQAEPSKEAEEPKQEDVPSDSSNKSEIMADIEKIFDKKTFNDIMLVSAILAAVTVAIPMVYKMGKGV